MNKGNEKGIYVFHNNSLRRNLKMQWQDQITTQEILRLSNMRPTTEPRNKMQKMEIFRPKKTTITSDCNIALSWTHEGRRKRGRRKTTRRRTDETEREESGRRSWTANRDGDPGLRRGLRLQTEMDGDLLAVDPYVPQGTKRIGTCILQKLFT